MTQGAPLSIPRNHLKLTRKGNKLIIIDIKFEENIKTVPKSNIQAVENSRNRFVAQVYLCFHFFSFFIHLITILFFNAYHMFSSLPTLPGPQGCLLHGIQCCSLNKHIFSILLMPHFSMIGV